MASRNPTRTGLTAEQVEQLRVEVTAGRAPRVHIAGAQFGGEVSGTVRAVGDPATDGEDYVTVRVKINGVTDDLRFAPRELTRGRRRGAATSTPSPTAAPTAARSGTTVKRPRTRAATVPTVPTVSPTPQAPPAPRTTRTRSGGRRGGAAVPVTIVLTSRDASWTLSAQRGARTVVKGAPVNPGVVSAIAALLDQPALDEAVAGINDSALAEAEARAQQLRTELAEIQAVLDGHRRP